MRIGCGRRLYHRPGAASLDAPTPSLLGGGAHSGTALVATFVTRRIGETAARDLFLRGHLIPATEAARIGLVTRAVPDADLDAELEALCHELATQTSGSAVAMTKALLADLPGRSLTEALTHAAAVNATARATDDCRAGVDAFLGKTDPPWRAAAG